MCGSDVRASNALAAEWAKHIDGTSTVFSSAGIYLLRGLLYQDHGISPMADHYFLSIFDNPILRILEGSPDIRAAVGCWSRPGAPSAVRMRRMLPTHMCGTLTGIPEKDQILVDSWVEDYSHGFIRHMPLDVALAPEVALLNALVTTIRWKNPFDDGALFVHEGPWSGRALRGLRATIPLTDHIAVAETSAGDITFLTMTGIHDVDVIVALGHPDTQPSDILTAAITRYPFAEHGRTSGPGLTTNGAATPNPLECDLSITTVAFTVTADHDLIDWLGAPPGIDQARQRVVATFHADGLHPAWTSDGFEHPSPSRESGHVTMTIDRPFGFMAVHRPTGLLVKAGWVNDPLAYSPEPTDD